MTAPAFARRPPNPARLGATIVTSLQAAVALGFSGLATAIAILAATDDSSEWDDLVAVFAVVVAVIALATAITLATVARAIHRGWPAATVMAIVVELGFGALALFVSRTVWSWGVAGTAVLVIALLITARADA